MQWIVLIGNFFGNVYGTSKNSPASGMSCEAKEQARSVGSAQLAETVRQPRSRGRRESVTHHAVHPLALVRDLERRLVARSRHDAAEEDGLQDEVHVPVLAVPLEDCEVRMRGGIE